MSKMDSCAIDSIHFFYTFTFYLEHCRIRKTKRQKNFPTSDFLILKIN
jgi:hypothetical protein